MHFQLDNTEDIAGFAATNARSGDEVEVIHRAALASDTEDFYRYITVFTNKFLGPKGISVGGVNQLLVVMHQDKVTDVYINDVEVHAEMKTKQAIEKGQLITLNMIRDIRRMKFPNVKITETDKVIYCMKIGWRFALFFDLSVRSLNDDGEEPEGSGRFDTDSFELTLGDLYRYLTFYDVFADMRSKPTFDVLRADGWFPFIELIPNEYDELRRMYRGTNVSAEHLDNVVKRFDRKRVEIMVSRWWQNPHFAERKRILKAGIEAFLLGTQDGYINSIKTLSTEFEGLLRSIYVEDTGTKSRTKISDLTRHLIERGKENSESGLSLLLPEPFLNYLNDVIFADFDPESDEFDISRHTVGHGFASADQYTASRSLQMLLVYDQIYSYGS